jgi:6-phosphogluconolactonase (cycloisomerase 2 family)
MRSPAPRCRIPRLQGRWQALWGLALSVLLLRAAAPAGADMSSTFVYVGAHQCVFQYRLHLRTGGTTPLTPPCVPVEQTPKTLVLHPSQRALYAVNEDASLTHFVRHPRSGQLTVHQRIPAQLLTGAMAVCPTGQFLYLLSHGASPDLPNVVDNSLWVFQLDPVSGAPLFVDTVWAGGNGVSSVEVDTRCESLYVAASVSNTVVQFRIDPQTGIPQRLNPPTVSTGDGSGPVAIRLDLADRFLYAANGQPVRGFGWSVAQFRRDGETGQLQPLTPLLVPAGPIPTSLTLDTSIDASNTFVSVPTFFDSRLSRYQREDSTGQLVPLTPPTVETAHGGGVLTVNAASTFAFVASHFDANVWRYRIQPGGGLQPLEPPLTPAPGRGPTNVVMTNPRVLQAQRDMRHVAAKTPHFRRPRYGTFAYLLLKDEQGEPILLGWEFTRMDFTVVVGQTRRTAAFYHGTNKADPTQRIIAHQDPVTGEVTGFEPVKTQ